MRPLYKEPLWPEMVRGLPFGTTCEYQAGKVQQLAEEVSKWDTDCMCYAAHVQVIPMQSSIDQLPIV